MPDVCCTRVASSPPGSASIVSRIVVEHVRQVRPVRAGDGHRDLERRRAPRAGSCGRPGSRTAARATAALLRTARSPARRVRRGHRHQVRDPAHLRRQDRVGHLAGGPRARPRARSPCARVCSAVSWVSSPAPSGSTNTPQISRSASYPDVPSTGHDDGQLLADAEDLLHQQPAVGPDRRAQPARVAAAGRTGRPGGPPAARRPRPPRPSAAPRRGWPRTPPGPRRGRRRASRRRRTAGRSAPPRRASTTPGGSAGGRAPPAADPSVRRARCDRERVLVVAQLGAVVGQRDLARRAPSPRRPGPAQHRGPAAGSGPASQSMSKYDAYRDSPAVGEDVPPPRVRLGVVHADVVRHDVEQEPQAALARGRDEGAPPLFAAARAAARVGSTTS